MLLLPVQARAAFGLTSSGGVYTVTTGSGLVFQINQSSGDMTSCTLNGTQIQDSSRHSQIASGLGTATVTGSTIGNFIVIACTTSSSNGVVTGLTHYYIAQNGFNNIYMATWVTAEPAVGELRYIFRGLFNVIPNGPAPSNNNGNTGAIESSDVFGYADGHSTSKYYGHTHAKDLTVKGATGTNLGVFMAFGNRESDSCGPFFGDIENQGDGTNSDQEIYNYMNSGHAQTEAWRANVLYGPYAYCFTTGATPAVPDMSFIANLGLTGYVGAAGRGAVSGSAITGRDETYPYTVGFSNTTAQYWTAASPTSGSFLCAGMKPGGYAMTVYKNELAVWTGSANVTASGTTSFGPIAITADPSAVIPRWRIGNWDGTPSEFLYSNLVTYMHPSDVRITGTNGTAAWNLPTYVVGTSNPATGIPCYQWKDVNGTQSIQFTLTASQLVASTIRVGITTAYAGGRPNITVNSFTTANQGASTQPSDRTMTVGTYRGNNTTYTFSVPASALVAGVNTLTIFPISGSSGTAYLSPGFGYDCIDMYQGTAATLAIPPAPASLTATPGSGQVRLVWPASSGATSYNIQRATVSGGPYTTIATVSTSAAFIDTAVTNGATYYYIVGAGNSSGFTNTSEVNATPSGNPLFAYLKFDETSGTTAADSTGDNWAGTLINGATWATGRINNAVSLDGTSGYVSVPPGIMNGVNDFTIAAWVKPATVTMWARVFDFGASTTDYMFLTPLGGASKVRYAINIGNGEQQIDGTAALTAGVWSHVAVTLSGSTGTLYVNGVAVGTNTAMTLTPNSLGSTTLNNIGLSQFSADPLLNGLVDDFRIYSRALSGTEVAALASPPGAPTGLAASAGSNQVSLTWNAVSGASAYNVARTTTSGSNYLTLASTGTTSYIDTSATNGTTYFYVVSASNPLAVGPNSAEAQATPLSGIQAWRLSNFGTISGTGNAADTAAPAGDGVPNLLKYATGENPNLPQQGPIAKEGHTSDGSTLTLTFNTIADPTLTYTVQASPDLLSWQTIWSATPTTGGSVIVSDTTPILSQPKHFLKLMVTH